MKLKIQIIHFLTGVILFEYETEENTIKKTVEEAVKRGAGLRGADLREADLRGAGLRGANLRGANLRGANLRGTNLREAGLWGADLRGAGLRGADLRGAGLRGADLWGANLRGAKNLKLYWHIHHEILVENLTESYRTRVKYIKENKSKDEIKLRLKLFKKVKSKILPYTKEGWEKLHKKECKNCPWTGSSIFKS